MSDPADENRPPFRRLPRAFRLKRKSLIRPLFQRGRDDVGSITRGSIRLLFRVVPRGSLRENIPVQIGFAPGRLPSAVVRNRVKRHLREVYRVHQQDLVDLFCDMDESLTMMIVYRGNGTDAAERIRADLPEALAELCARLGETSMSTERRV